MAELAAGVRTTVSTGIATRDCRTTPRLRGVVQTAAKPRCFKVYPCWPSVLLALGRNGVFLTHLAGWREIVPCDRFGGRGGHIRECGIAQPGLEW